MSNKQALVVLAEQMGATGLGDDDMQTTWQVVGTVRPRFVWDPLGMTAVLLLLGCCQSYVYISVV